MPCLILIQCTGLGNGAKIHDLSSILQPAPDSGLKHKDKFWVDSSLSSLSWACHGPSSLGNHSHIYWFSLNLHSVSISNQAFSRTTTYDPMVPWFIMPFFIPLSFHPECVGWLLFSLVCSLALKSDHLSLFYPYSSDLPSFRLVCGSEKAS